MINRDKKVYKLYKENVRFKIERDNIPSNSMNYNHYLVVLIQLCHNKKALIIDLRLNQIKVEITKVKEEMYNYSDLGQSNKNHPVLKSRSNKINIKEIIRKKKKNLNFINSQTYF